MGGTALEKERKSREEAAKRGERQCACNSQGRKAELPATATTATTLSKTLVSPRRGAPSARALTHLNAVSHVPNRPHARHAGAAELVHLGGACNRAASTFVCDMHACLLALGLQKQTLLRAQRCWASRCQSSQCTHTRVRQAGSLLLLCALGFATRNKRGAWRFALEGRLSF
jgi:hypothetical protein